ncbi:EAL and HDOD domain-containing protein [Paucidesulfovibrio longus]|uniref:EAL and HDOD domain-containing protein n=1 Tax=Paucidesulfovibrio longus TaxID=889 RepID=UPI0003B5BF89|nr:HDOD domain-containing protein [Paucidesulfovibrio longus]
MPAAAPPLLGNDSDESVFVARQPIFSADQEVWGYELLFRSSASAQTAQVTDDDLATSQVIADGFTLARPGLHEGQRMLVNFPERLLLEETALALPPDICVVEILETVAPTEAVLDKLRQLKAEGYTIAMDDYAGEPELEPFLDVADILKMDILALGSDPQRIRDALAQIGGRKLRLLAEKVENEEVFRTCAELGFELFQGFFFSRPEIIPGRKVPAGMAAKLGLLKELSDPDFSAERIAQIINTDPSLSYRLFRYVNSAAFGLRSRVESVSHAVNMIGQRPLARWLQAVILADLNPSSRASEVSFLSLQRARFLENLAPAIGLPPQNAFTLGLFSLLDSLLRVSMDEILAQLPLEEEMASALMGICDCRMGFALDLARGYERGDIKGIGSAAQALGLKRSDADRACVEALAWVQDVLAESKH